MRKIRQGRLVFMAATAVLLCLSAGLPALADGGGTPLPAGRAESSCDWPMYGGGPARTMSSQCPGAPSASSVRTLVPAWHVHTPDVVTATPTVVDGVVYVGDWSGNFFAFDLATGSQIWKTVIGPSAAPPYKDQHRGSYGTITSSAAVATVKRGGKPKATVFVGGGGSLYALDAGTGAILWQTNFDPAHPTSSGEVESSPVVWEGAPGGPTVFVGSDANQDSGYVGEGIWALDAATGAVRSHWNPESPDVSAPRPLYGCGNVWSSPALDVGPGNSAVLYFGTADCPDNSGTPCPSDGSDPACTAGKQYNYANRWTKNSESLIALSVSDPSRPSEVWSYQAHPTNSNDDDDYGASAQLFELSNGTRVVGLAGKDGYYEVVRRADGVLVWRTSETGNGNVQPGFALGGFIGTTAVGEVAAAPRVFGGVAINTPITYDSGGNPTLQDPATLERGVPGFQAFSGTDGSNAWSGVQGYSYGPTSTANGVVYTGSLDGTFRALDASTGLPLWAFPLGAPISSGAAVGNGAVVVGEGTSESDVEFKLCADQAPAALRSTCEQTPLDQTLNPLGDLGGVWAFREAAA